MMEKIGEEKKEYIESNKYVKNNKVDFHFIFNHYGNCTSFLNEILQTEGIIPEEHEVLNEISKLKSKYESRGGDWLVMLYGVFHFRLFLNKSGSFTKLLIAISYPLFFFDISYNLGRIMGNSIFMAYNLNKLLNLREGKSIHSIQTRLFVKRCLEEDFMKRKKLVKKQEWLDSYVINKVFGKTFLRFRETKEYFNKMYQITNIKVFTKSDIEK